MYPYTVIGTVRINWDMLSPGTVILIKGVVSSFRHVSMNREQLTWAGSIFNSEAALSIMSSAIIIPCGPPNPLNAVLDGVLVKQILPIR